MQVNQQKSIPEKIREWWEPKTPPDKAGILSLWILIAVLIFNAPTIVTFLNEKDRESKELIASQKQTIVSFVGTNIGEMRVMDNFYSGNGHYGAQVSVDPAKPMVNVRCRMNDNVCWVKSVVD